MTQIRVDVREVREYFSGLLKTLQSKEPLLKRIGLYGVEVSKEAFRDGKDPETGEKWEKLNSAYARWKAKHRYSATPLTRKARLRRSIHSVISGKKSVAIGTDVSYGKYHQLGTKRIPRRRFLGLSRGDMKEIEDVAARWIRGRNP